MIENIIRDIICAKNNRAYISALSLALTLPNILSNIEHNAKTYKPEYIQWFDRWVYKHYDRPKSENESINRSIDATKFDGESCYLLRCALLHAGNTDLIDNHKNRRIDFFELCVSEISTHCGDASVCSVSNNDVSNVYVSVNVVGLIDSLIMGANEFLEANKEKVLMHQNSNISMRTFGGIEIKTFQADSKNGAE